MTRWDASTRRAGLGFSPRLLNASPVAFLAPSAHTRDRPRYGLADLRRKGLIRHIGLSNVTAAQVAEAQAITDVVGVQNNYNLAYRHDDALIDDLARQGIAYVPFFPGGWFTPLQSSTLSSVAGRLGATPMQVALAWLPHRAPKLP